LTKVQDKEKILETIRERNQVTFMGSPIRLTISKFLSRNPIGGRAWNDLFLVLKENNCQPRLLYTAKLTFKNKGEIDTPK
jgi:hypothetical protein